MLVSLKSWLSGSVQLISLLAIVLVSASVALGQAQSNAADLQGTVTDTTGAVVPNATVTVRNPATNVTRDATTNDQGLYRIINIPPGDYEVSVEAPNFKKAVLTKVTVTVGQAANIDVVLEPGQITESVTISETTSDIVETSKTAVSTTIDQQRINNLPINERNYLSFALTTSTVGRDAGRPIGPAPTTGLNFGGQRGRSNLVQVDGADNTDNSVNASRSTVSQEAVQEFQVVTNSFAPEFGRSAGGVVNVVTKSGTNDLHGNIFGFLRHRSFQARNAFAPIEDPPFTRTQYGFTIGGPFDRDRTFFFFAFEQRRRNESGFFTSDVARGLTSSVTLPPLAPGFPAQTLGNLRPEQAAYINNLLAQGGQIAQLGIAYAYLASGGASTALTGFNPLLATAAPFTPGTPIGNRFFLTGAPIPLNTTNSLGQPIAFRPLNNLQRIFPVTDRTTFNSFRLDHLITSSHQFTFRFGYNPSEITGIQVESQNQSLGQNDFSRTGIQTLRDVSAVVTLTSTLSNNVVNEGRFNFGLRRATFKSANGDAVASNISGTAFIGRELFSPVLRTETRFQFTDNVNVVAGNHNFKFGGDVAFINIPEAIFELNFAGLFNFGGISACTLVTQLCTLPAALQPPAGTDFTAVQQYGLGFPSNFIQGFGNPISSISNKPIAFFAQDSWKVRPNVTLNYGVRYDYEITEQIPTLPLRDPLSGIMLSAADVLAAQDAMGIQQGFPRDKNNWAPRLAVAWDPGNNGKTVLRAAFGIFYDHPLLAISFNSDIADAVQQQQGILTPGSPAPTALLNAAQVFQGTVCPPGGGNPLCPPGVVTPGVAAGAQYQFGRQRFNDQTFPGFGPVLPFTLHVQKNFEYAYANQGNFTIERELTKDMTISGSYIHVGARHLPHPLDINAPRTDLQIQNFFRLAGRNPVNTTEAVAFSIPTSGVPCPGGVPLQCFTLATPVGATAFPNAGQTFAIIIPGMVTAPLTNLGSRIVNAGIANFFRPSAPN